MGKQLTEMTLEELWELFPIFLVEHDEKWNIYFAEIEDLLLTILEAYPIRRISHIGSTAIPGIMAKNIVDVLLEIPKSIDMEAVAQLIEQNGFIRMSTAPERISFNRGYTPEGFAEKVYHVHLRYEGDHDEL